MITLPSFSSGGYSTTSTFGGPVNTPNFTKLAESGLRYNEFHVNSICAPSRAALLSGRNNHEIGFGTITEHAQGYPGYNSVWPKSSASIAKVLVENGYSTAAFGKWHNTPVWEALHQLIRALRASGEGVAGALLAGMPQRAEPIRSLAYRLYTLCERKGWAEDARAYNELITSWVGIEEASHVKGHLGSQVAMDI